MKFQKVCANPNCREDFEPYNDDEEYCSEECRIAVEGSSSSNYTTLSISWDAKSKISQLQRDIQIGMRTKYSYSELITDMYNLLNKDNNIKDLLITQIKKRLKS